MRKIFLCHSSFDKGYVEIVARKLGRARVVFDALSFDPGRDFRDEIKKHLASTDLFVFFASKASLGSVWCKYEIDEAYFSSLASMIQGFLTIIIDEQTTFSDLPRWMQRTKAMIQTRPSQGTRDIQHALFAVYAPLRQKPFVGRQTPIEEFTNTLGLLGEAPKKLFIVTGLDGVGRRSYLERVCRDILGSGLEPICTVDDTSGLEEIYLWLLGETSDLGSRTELASEIVAFGRIGEREQVERIVEILAQLCASGCIPCLVDEGGMLDQEGRYLPKYAHLMEHLAATDADLHLAVVHKRRPLIREIPFSANLLWQRIPPLSESETQLLLSQLLKKEGVSAKPAQIAEIAPFLAGYPPAVYFSAQYARQYGLDVLLSDKSLLVDFQARRFSRYLTELALSDQDWLLLQYLASEKYLQLSALAVPCNRSVDDLTPSLRRLIDISLVVTADERFSIAAPIRDAVFRAKGMISAGNYEDIRKRLTEAFWSSSGAAPTIEVVDATLNAIARSGSSTLNPYEDLVRVSTVHRLAKECYHGKSWELALSYALQAQRMDPGRREVGEIAFKALVQMERWENAERQLAQLREQGWRTAPYLQGFMLRKRRKYREAIAAFQSAIDSGDRSNAVHRDMADSLFRVGEYDKALESVKRVLARDSENIFVLDLVVRIAHDARRLDIAEQYLSQLERLDRECRFIYHRRARHFAAKNLWDLALIETEKACAAGHAPFEAFAQRIDIEIEMVRFAVARTHLEELETRFRSHRSDVQKGLRCKLLIREGKWREARSVWDTLDDKSTAMMNALLQRILDLKASDTSLGLVDRERARAEALEVKRIVERLQLPSLEEVHTWDDLDDSGSQIEV